MRLVTVLATYDNELQFSPDGKTLSIPVDSLIVGFKSLPTGPVIPGATGAVDTANYLAIKTKTFGIIYLDMTLDEYNDAIRDASRDPNADITYTATISGDTTRKVTIPDVVNAHLISASWAGADVDLRTITWVSTESLGTSATFPEDLGDGSVVQLVYYIK